jgi:catechol 2,3-dioxygenase-like lactoylglutathione lyase family enzyme
VRIDRLDQLVLTVADLEATIEFYSHVLGMEVATFADGREAVAFGNQKINLHQAGHEFEPKASRPMPGSADLCFVSETSLETWGAYLAVLGMSVKLGPVERTGALGTMRSIYLRDPDGNLIEIANY